VLAVLGLLPLVFLLADLPSAVLAAIVVTAVVPLIQFGPVARLWRHSPPAALIAAGTFAATLAFAPRIERGVLVGIRLSVAVHLWRELRVDHETWREDGVLHIRPQGVLWFGAAEVLEDIVLTELPATRMPTACGCTSTAWGAWTSPPRSPSDRSPTKPGARAWTWSWSASRIATGGSSTAWCSRAAPARAQPVTASIPAAIARRAWARSRV